MFGSKLSKQALQQQFNKGKNFLGKAYNDTRYLVDDLVKKSKQTDDIMLVQQKLNNLELYINTLKSLDAPKITGGRKTRKNSRK
jgi:hypothetical protein